MDCPRCRLSLTEAEYEGENVRFCETCWGYWMTRCELERIIRSAHYEFGDEEQQAVRWSMELEGDVNRQGSEDQKVHCPVCGAPMARRQYTPQCPVKIDECDQHGVWLDTGEIKDLQVFLEQHSP